MSFSQDVRSQLAGLMPEKACCQRATLLALLSVSATEAAVVADRPCVVVSVENGAVARLLFRLAKTIWGEQPNAVLPERKPGRPYRLMLSAPAEGLEETTTIQDLQKQIRRRACCRRSFLRGAFLGCGSLVDPERAYHLEFTAPGEVSAWIVTLLQGEGIRAGHYQRHGHSAWTAYLKSSDDIGRFLTRIGAMSAMLRLEEVRTSRDLKNNIQRTVNCETANLERTVTTAQKQIDAIERLNAAGLIEDLSDELRETALLRLEFPYASLAELAEQHSEPLSKSAINHRLRKLLELAESMASVR